jgi:hypothetical protein
MFELWGMRRDYIQRTIGGSFDPEDTRERVATFSTEALALAYVKASELKKGTNTQDRQRGYYRFRKNSLLRYYDDYEIVGFDSTSVPHDPVI